MAKELRDKECLPPGRKNMLYIGEKAKIFEPHYQKLMDLKRKEEDKRKDE